MTKLRGLCIERRILGVLLLTMGLMAMPAMGDHPACAPGAGDCCTDTGSPRFEVIWTTRTPAAPE